MQSCFMQHIHITGTTFCLETCLSVWRCCIKKNKQFLMNEGCVTIYTFTMKFILWNSFCITYQISLYMFYLTICSLLIVLRENCKSKQVIDFIAWPSRCHGRIYNQQLFLFVSKPRFKIRNVDWNICQQFPKHFYFSSLLT
jgi:hypothetical protein